VTAVTMIFSFSTKHLPVAGKGLLKYRAPILKQKVACAADERFVESVGESRLHALTGSCFDRRSAWQWPRFVTM